MKKILIIIITILFFISCEKEIKLNLPPYSPKIIVEGWIENDNYPIIVLSRSSSYFAPLDSAYLVDSLFIKNALVVVSDGAISDTLSFFLDINAYLNKSWPMVYYKGSKIKGKEGKAYTLYIEADGKKVSGYTTIPYKVGFDTIYWEQAPGKKDSLGYLYGIFTDPINEKNYYRTFAKRLGIDYNYIPILGSLFDDVYLNNVQNFKSQISRGELNYKDEELFKDEEMGLFKRGDTVVVKMSSIDREHYYFWRAMEEEAVTGGNPFTNPAPIKSNVVGAIGVFGGYGSDYDTIVIK